MELSDYVGNLRGELASITRFAGEDITRAAEMLTEALDSSVRLTLLDVLSAAAEEITTHLEDTIIDVRLSGGEPQFVATTVEMHTTDDTAAQASADSGDEAGSARITLRVSETLKARIESAAGTTGMSVNAWLVQAASRALDDLGGSGGSRRSRSGIGQRVTGYARS
jgi:hypothetical protein